MARKNNAPVSRKRIAKANDLPPVNPAPTSFPIVGIGASAGGLKAIETFLKNVPPHAGICFVIIQHLDPERKSIMAELLQRMTAMKVVEAKNRMQTRPDTVIVLPPNRDMTIRNRVLRLVKPAEPRGLRLPIDGFLRALAQDQQAASIGVILSGMGSDGSQGLKIIKEYAGSVFVQDPASAEFDSMPRAAIETGFADVVAPPEQLPGKIIDYINHVPNLGAPESVPDQPTRSNLEKIIILIRTRTGHDFSQYKMTSIRRRIERRMGLLQIKGIPDYVRRLRENPREIELLAKDLLIGVTSFFRDDEVWEELKRRAIPALLTGRRRVAATPIRAWVAGCSTGEEAYSLVMVIKEAMEKAGTSRGLAIQVFATDLDTAAIEKARLGIYPSSIEADIPASRLKRFFIREARGFRINREIREAVTFAPHNLVMDPPFSRLDIISCRNLLIYLSPELQNNILPLFHYALNPGGILILGNAESLGSAAKLFAVISAPSRLFRRAEVPTRQAVEFPSSYVATRPSIGTKPAAGKTATVKTRARAKISLADFQAAQEELKSTNEELQSANEELQSTNEELTTSKEEMQSINEELQTLNQELRAKSEDLTSLNNDLQNFMDSTDAATLFLDTSLNIRRFTARATELIKLIPADAGRAISDFATRIDYPELADDALKVLRTLVGIDKTVKSNDDRWFMVRIVPYRTLGNVIDGVVVNFTDITELKQAGERLVRAEKMAAVGHLASGVAHEFNNILNNISLCNQVMAIDPRLASFTDLKEKMGDVMSQVDRGVEIVKGMISLADPGSNDPVVCKVSELVDEALRVQRQQLELENIALHFDIDPALTVKVKFNRVVQVFLNIIINSRHAMQPNRSGALFISAGAASGKVHIRFRDTGIGMNEAIMKKALEPFFTTKGAFATDALGIKGTGLGLSVSYSIIQSENGDITITSSPGQGTTVTVILPVAVPVDAEPKIPAAAAIDSAAGAEPSRKPSEFSILVVDDELMVDTSLCRFLRDYGYPVTFCSDSQVAADLIAGPSRFSLIILDENMPRFKGSDLALLAQGTNQSAVIIMITGQLENTRLTPERASLGVKHVFAKPLDLREIHKTIQGYL